MHNKASLALSAAIMVCAGYAVYAASGWPWKAALFPMAIGVPVFLLAAAEAAWALFGSADGARAMDFELSQEVPEPIARRRTWGICVWITGFCVAIVMLGFPVAVALFILLYLRIQGGESWLFSLVFSAAVWGFFYAVFAKLLKLPFPAGWVQGWSGF